MIYLHKYFKINDKSKKVFDENGKELRITGNAFRLLVFLCENKNANITEIGECLDSAKEYDENNIRQYKYKINTVIGRDIVEYKNAVYSIVGEIKKIDKVDENYSVEEKTDRNTDLLRSENIKYGGIMKNISKYPAIIVSVLLLLTFFPWAYGYYTILRWAVCLTAICYIIGFCSKTQVFDTKIWVLVSIAVLFNPITPIFLYSKSVWGVVDILVAIFFVYLVNNLKNYERNY